MSEPVYGVLLATPGKIRPVPGAWLAESSSLTPPEIGLHKCSRNRMTRSRCEAHG